MHISATLLQTASKFRYFGPDKGEGGEGGVSTVPAYHVEALPQNNPVPSIYVFKAYRAAEIFAVWYHVTLVSVHQTFKV